MTRMLVGSVTERAIKLTSVGGKVKTVEKEEVTKVKVKARTRAQEKECPYLIMTTKAKAKVMSKVIAKARALAADLALRELKAREKASGH